MHEWQQYDEIEFLLLHKNSDMKYNASVCLVC